MIPFVDEVLNTLATGGKIKYRITHEDNTTELVQMELATPVETEGTEMNKIYFDSIQTDLTNLEIKSGTYIGNGNTTISNFSNLGYLPRFALIIGRSTYNANDRFYGDACFFVSRGTNYPQSGRTFEITKASGSGDIGTHMSTSTQQGLAAMKLITTANGFTLQKTSPSGTTSFNMNGEVYNYVLIR